MKYITLSKIIVLLLLFAAAACKKKGNCGENNCQSNETCVNGECITCAANMHWENGACLCDEGWMTPDCEVPIGSYAGIYYVTGTAQLIVLGQPVDTSYADDTIEITRSGNVLFANGKDHQYNDYFFVDTAAFVSFLHGMGSNFSQLNFHKTFDDSLFYRNQSGSLAGGVFLDLRGKKI